MPSPTKIQKARHYGPKSWRACLAITVLPVYATTLLLIGRAATVDHAPLPFPSGTAPAASARPRPRDARLHRALARDIAARWNLTSPAAPDLLARQFLRADAYDPRTDFLHFHHIPKAGGTTVSDVLNATLGASVAGHRGILPGSDRSGRFRAAAVRARGNATAEGNTAGAAFPYLASYAHTRLRPVHGPNRTELAAFFDEYFALPGNAPRRLRSLAMLREPTNLRASNHAMAMCSLNGKVNDVNWKRKTRGLGPICTPEQGLNVSRFVDVMVDRALAECPGGVEDTTAKLDKYEKILCRRGRRAMDFCRSPSHLLASAQYTFGMRSMLRSVMGRFVAREQMGEYDYHSQADPRHFSVEEVEDYTLTDLGGLDAKITYAADAGLVGKRPPDAAGALAAEPDFLWFGITERMTESTCLLCHALRVAPLAAVPRARVVDCPPTSWWTREHRDEVRRREPADYAVWRAANALLDVRVWRMRAEVRAGLAEGRGLPREERERYAAFVEARCA